MVLDVKQGGVGVEGKGTGAEVDSAAAAAGVAAAVCVRLGQTVRSRRGSKTEVYILVCSSIPVFPPAASLIIRGRDNHRAAEEETHRQGRPTHNAAVFFVFCFCFAQ